MENSIEQSRRQTRAGYWQYPDLSPDNGGETSIGSPAQSMQRRAAQEANIGSALGWISVGLGLASLLVPRMMARSAGLPDWPAQATLMRMIGLRELVSGVGLLNDPDNQVWRWSRVAGDAMDLTVLGIAAVHPDADRTRLASSAVVLGSIAALDLRAGNPPRITPSSQAIEGPQGGQRVQHAVSINRAPDECYRFWRDLARLPTFMEHLVSVEVINERRSHWCARAPAGRKVEWDADITEDQPGQLLAWRSVAGADVDNEGSVRFTAAPGGGTVVQVQMIYQPPAGRAGAMVAKLFGEEPSIQVKQDLRRFKQLIETGEIPTTKGQPTGKRSAVSSLFRKGVDK